MLKAAFGFVSAQQQAPSPIHLKIFTSSCSYSINRLIIIIIMMMMINPNHRVELKAKQQKQFFHAPFNFEMLSYFAPLTCLFFRAVEKKW